MKKVLFIKADNWEALYVDDDLVTQDHHLFEQDPFYVLELAEEHVFKYDEVETHWVEPEDDEILYTEGYFPNKRSELKGNYES